MLEQSHKSHFQTHTHATLKPEGLNKLHLQHHHMSRAQFRLRTRELNLLKDIYNPYDKIRSECELCQKAAIAPSRSKTRPGDQAFMAENWDSTTVGPMVLWRNQAETAVRLIKRQVSLMLNSIKAGMPASLKEIAYKQLAALELAFGRRPAPSNWTRLHHHNDGTSRSTCAGSKPIVIGDSVFYWSEDKSKINPDGSKGGMWLSVNIAKLRENETKSPSRPGLDLPCSDNDLHKHLLEQAKSAEQTSQANYQKDNTRSFRRTSSFLLRFAHLGLQF